MEITVFGEQNLLQDNAPSFFFLPLFLKSRPEKYLKFFTLTLKGLSENVRQFDIILPSEMENERHKKDGTVYEEQLKLI